MSKIIARGAEAIIVKEKSSITKERIKKSYRIPQLDEKLRKLRTRHEKKILTKASKIIPTPKILKSDEKTNKITMDFIEGRKLSEDLEKLDFKKISKQIGKNIALLHDSDIIHGDLTTSNMILSKAHKTSSPDNKLQIRQHTALSNSKIGRNHKNSVQFPKQEVFFIDYGLGFHSPRIEDKAVDLYLIKQALEAKHPTIYEQAFKSILQGYKISKNYKKTLTRLEKVERRGRYKAQY